MIGLKMKYFVLKPGGTNEYARASRCAIETYAATIEDTNEQLAQDLITWIDEIEEANND